MIIMNRKDILELKRRLKKESCTITKMCGCYVDANKNKVVELNETFLNLDDEEFYKYLDIAKKTLSGGIGNNLLELDFPLDEEKVGGKQQFFLALRESELKNESLLERLYDLIIENYQYVGNYLILLFHDTYDIITKTNDNLKIDESEEVYDYLLCAICPVALSKPGLGYRQDENRIGARIRDWVVGAPDMGFLFPAFLDRSADIHKAGYFIKDAKDSHPEFVEGVLGCGAKRTATEQKEVFHTIVKRALGPDKDKAKEVLINIQESLNNRIEETDGFSDEDTESIVLTADTIAEVLNESGLAEDEVKAISQSCKDEFKDELPPVKNLIDAKALEENAKIKKEQELVKEVQELKSKLIEKDSIVNDEEISGDDVKTYDVILRVKPDKADQIKSHIIGDKKYLMIPMEENEFVNLNGVNTQV